MKKIYLIVIGVCLISVSLFGFKVNAKVNSYNVTQVQANGIVNENIDAITQALRNFFTQAGKKREETDVPGEVDDSLNNMGDKIGRSVSRMGEFTRLLIGDSNYNKIITFRGWVVNSAKYIIQEFGKALGNWFN